MNKDGSDASRPRSAKATRTGAAAKPGAVGQPGVATGPDAPAGRHAVAGRRMPSPKKCRALLEQYGLPAGIIDHSELVTEIAGFLAQNVAEHGSAIDVPRTVAGAFLHDIGKTPKAETDSRLQGLNHAEASARIVVWEGYPDLAPVVLRHMAGDVLDPSTAPVTLEEKIVHYADKVATRTFISLDDRFSDLCRRYPKYCPIFEQALPLVKKMEEEVLAAAGLSFQQLRQRFGYASRST